MAYDVVVVVNCLQLEDFPRDSPDLLPSHIQKMNRPIIGIIGMLQYFACEKPLRFCHFAANSSTLQSYLYCGGGIPALSLLLQRTLHTLVRFASCHRSDCSVLAARAS